MPANQAGYAPGFLSVMRDTMSTGQLRETLYLFDDRGAVFELRSALVSGR